MNDNCWKKRGHEKSKRAVSGCQYIIKVKRQWVPLFSSVSWAFCQSTSPGHPREGTKRVKGLSIGCQYSQYIQCQYVNILPISFSRSPPFSWVTLQYANCALQDHTLVQNDKTPGCFKCTIISNIYLSEQISRVIVLSSRTFEAWQLASLSF